MLSISRVVPSRAAASRRRGRSGAGRAQRLGIGQLDIVDREARRDQRLARAGQRGVDRRRARSPLAATPSARGSATACARSSVVEIDVARRQREPVVLALRRHADDLDRPYRGRRPCGGSPRAAGNPSRRNSATSGRTWLNSLATTVATPSKCPGRAAPSSPSLTPATDMLVAKPSGYIVSTGGQPQQVAARPRPASACRRSPRAGIAARSSPGAELLRVDEDRRDHASCPARLRRLDQRDVPGVQRAHRRHQRDARAVRAQSAQRGRAARRGHGWFARREPLR